MYGSCKSGIFCCFCAARKNSCELLMQFIAHSGHSSAHVTVNAGSAHLLMDRAFWPRPVYAREWKFRPPGSSPPTGKQTDLTSQQDSPTTTDRASLSEQQDATTNKLRPHNIIQITPSRPDKRPHTRDSPASNDEPAPKK